MTKTDDKQCVLGQFCPCVNITECDSCEVTKQHNLMGPWLCTQFVFDFDGHTITQHLIVTSQREIEGGGRKGGA